MAGTTAVISSSSASPARACVYGTITDGNTHPLVDVSVTFNDLTDARTSHAYSGQSGKYGFCTLAGIQANLTVRLENSGIETEGIRIADPALNVVNLTGNSFTLLGDTTQDIDFGNTPGIGATSVSPAQRLPDYATMYFHTHQALEFAQEKLDLKLDSQMPEHVYGHNPEKVTFHCSVGNCTHSPPGASPDHIAIGRTVLPNASVDSAVNSTNRPDNRERHEFGHHIMLDSPIAGDNSMPTTPSGDINHGGFYTNSRTADSWIEGWGGVRVPGYGRHHRGRPPATALSLGLGRS